MGWEDDADRLIAGLVEEARAEVPDLVERTLGAVVRAVPFYGEIRRRADLDDVRSSFRRSVELGLACLAEDRAPRDDELWPFALVGAQRARQGIPAEDVAAAVELARAGGRTSTTATRNEGADVPREESLVGMPASMPTWPRSRFGSARTWWSN